MIIIIRTFELSDLHSYFYLRKQITAPLYIYKYKFQKQNSDFSFIPYLKHSETITFKYNITIYLLQL